MNKIQRALERAATTGRKTVEVFDYGDEIQARKAAHVRQRSLVFRLAKRGLAKLERECAACRSGSPHSGCTDVYRLADGSTFTARSGMLL